MPKILLVDDDKINGKFLQNRLIKRNIKCDYVESGKECLDLLAKEEYNLILLDIMMPDISGTEVLSQLREKFNNFELPVIMVTSKDETKDIVLALQAGANDYLTKPVNIDIAVARIQTQTQIQELIKVSLESKQIQTINTLVTTLNHEINNPLAIAVGNLSIAKINPDQARISKALEALERITEIVKKIETIAEGNIEEESYSSKAKMYKIR